MTSERPWLKYYNGIAPDIDIPDVTMYEWLREIAGKYPDGRAVAFLGASMSFASLLADVDRCASALTAIGVGPGDSVLVCLPNIPDVIVLFYAINRVGARAVMTHPLSSTDELKHFATETNSRWAFGIDMFAERLLPLMDLDAIEKVVLTSIPDYLGAVMTVGYKLTKGRGVKPIEPSPKVMRWAAFMNLATAPAEYVRRQSPTDGSVVLFSGGTTSLPKGIELSSRAFNGLAVSMIALIGIEPGDSVLAIMPAFHGFGLGLCIHTCLMAASTSLLVPEVGTKSYVEALIKQKPKYIAGVPTLFQALMQMDDFKKVDFSGLRGAYAGGDTLTPDLKRRFDEALRSHGGNVELEEGYGLTECVTGCVISPTGHYRTGSIGVPMPGTLAMIVKPDTTEELPPDTEGEICIQSDMLMNRYIGDEEATAATLRRHDDGLVWLHTGDLGKMDADGYLYFAGRIKRIVKVSGVSVYPAQVEQLLENHPAIKEVCVIGVPDDYQMSSVKAFVVLMPGYEASDELVAELRAYGKQHLMKWSVPRKFEFRDELPHTKVGKVAYTVLEEEEAAKVA
ncbi:MAG: AMP-binding protein [Micrococcales bacterium]|nr:AMP-binding protein [Micrococcales bacterium]